jgi:tripartite-type tricarboxylate transporter receptor subunit TctC
VPWAPGGTTDILGRVLAQKMGEKWGQPVLVDNRGGAAGNIGGEAAARSPADGYTLLLGTMSSHAMNQFLYAKMSFDPVADLAPISLVANVATVLVVHPSLPAGSVNELVALARSRPGQLNFASGGVASFNQLCAELFKMAGKIDIVHVPYKGAFEAVTGVMAEQVQMFFGDIGGVLPLIREGRVRALAISSRTRSADLPALPTMIESGVPGYVVLTYTGVVAPAATPDQIVQKLNAALNASLRTPEAAAALRRIGAESEPSSAQDFAAFLSAERDKWREVVRLSGIKIE